MRRLLSRIAAATGSGTERRDEAFPQWAAGGETVPHRQFGESGVRPDIIRAIDADGAGDHPLTSGRANDWSPDPYPLPRV